jgi:hypothetical protein
MVIGLLKKEFSSAFQLLNTHKKENPNAEFTMFSYS